MFTPIVKSAPQDACGRVNDAACSLRKYLKLCKSWPGSLANLQCWRLPCGSKRLEAAASNLPWKDAIELVSKFCPAPVLNEARLGSFVKVGRSEGQWCGPCCSGEKTKAEGLPARGQRRTTGKDSEGDEGPVGQGNREVEGRESSWRSLL